MVTTSSTFGSIAFYALLEGCLTKGLQQTPGAPPLRPLIVWLDGASCSLPDWRPPTREMLSQNASTPTGHRESIAIGPIEIADRRFFLPTRWWRSTLGS
jgi:hypothetical protein